MFGSKYSNDQRALTEMEIKRIVSDAQMETMNAREEGIVERAIAARRLGDGRISLRQIYETLTKLKNERLISEQDRAAVTRRFEGFFGS